MTIRVLIVDDSALMRALLQHRLEREADIAIVGTAANAAEARQLIKTLDPDVVTLDIEMPGMDGLSFLEKIMQLRPTPVILVSGATEAGASATARGLQLGAIGCIAKSQLSVTPGAGDDGALVDMVREAARARGHLGPPRQASSPPAVPVPAANAAAARPDVIVIGASTGGVEALHTLLASFPADCPPTLIVQHINGCFAGAIAQSFDRAIRPRVMLAESDMPLEPGTVLLAPGNERHLQVAAAGARGLRCVLREGDPVSGHRPSVDRLFASLASTLAANGGGPRALGVLLTGMGQDGAQGMAQLASIGARTIAQDQATCVVFGMPRAAIDLGAAGEVLPLPRIGPSIFTPAKAVLA
ncbi:chemotaxis response regulator protein-glutamate methylesterase [Porphyrobacter sp. YT40]|uniref:protein-glutamate methylesterase/protein-glutamine glutaminase n=1 Tax=Porphyrobacter sp. YT40 TaxID=2547601 RepID=UPI001142E894|nr:chemotaxis response regulator protein-glutamate methylesterase [Porphyrobacter sp. YT40]QDH35367.1 chemotaxis response regulator protein-glutamate methylesterase [Porphyrobacter sp. YT40]